MTTESMDALVQEAKAPPPNRLSPELQERVDELTNDKTTQGTEVANEYAGVNYQINAMMGSFLNHAFLEERAFLAEVLTRWASEFASETLGIASAFESVLHR